MRYLLSATFLFLSLSLIAQVTIVDHANSDPLVGATIVCYCEEGEKQLVSDLNGSFEVPCEIYSHILVAAFGYSSRRVEAPIPAQIELVELAFEIDPAIVTGQLSERNSSQAVQQVRVVTAGEIESSGAVSAKDVLELEGNLQFSQDPSLGSSGGINGMNPEHLQILIDGVPVIGRLNGAIDLDQIPVNNIERIEIITGPMSVEYGSEAIAGTINIITKKPNSDAVNVKVGAYAETTSRTSLDLSTNFGIGNWGVKLGGNRINFNGIEYADERGHSWKPKTQNAIDMRVARSWKKGDLLLSTQIVDETLFIDGQQQAYLEQRPLNDSIVEIYSIPFAVDQEFQTTRKTYGLKWNALTEKRWKIVSTSSFNDYRRERRTFRNDLRSDEREITSNLEDQDTSRFLLAFNRTTLTKEFDRMNFSVGLEAKGESGKGKRIESGSQQMGEIAGFIASELELGKFLLRPGFRIMYNSAFNAPLIPSVGLKYTARKVTLRASYGRGFKAPELKDLFFFFVDSNHNIRGNTDLKAEESHNVQVSVSRNWLREEGILKARMSAFYNDVTNQISLVNSTSDASLFQYQNIDEATFFGSGINIEWIAEQLRLNASSNLLYQSNLIEEIEGEFNAVIQASLSGSYLIPKPEIRLELRWNFFGPRQSFLLDENADLVEARIESYQLINLLMSKSFFDNRLKADIGIRNVLDVRTINQNAVSSSAHSPASGQQLISPGRNALLRLNYFIK